MPANPKPASMDAAADVPFRSASIEAVIIRADGTRIPIGRIAAYHRNPVIRWWRQWQARRTMARFYREHPDRRPKEQTP